MHIGRSLRAKREAKFLTQERLAAAARISQKQISQIERNEVEPRFSTILRLAEVLGVAPSDLVDKEED